MKSHKGVSRRNCSRLDMGDKGIPKTYGRISIENRTYLAKLFDAKIGRLTLMKYSWNETDQSQRLKPGLRADMDGLIRLFLISDSRELNSNLLPFSVTSYQHSLLPMNANICVQLLINSSIH